MNAKSATRSAADSPAGGGTRIQSVARAGQLLLWIAQHPDGATAKEIAAAQGSNLPTTYHLLNTLVDEGLLAKDGNRRYVLGRSIAVLAQAYLRSRSVPEALLGALRELTRRTGETSYLADWGENNEIRTLASVEGSHMLRVAEVSPGPYEHGHARANGKVLLAYAPAEIRAAYRRNHPLVPVTSKTVCDPARFDEELELIRQRGYAYDEEGFAEGVCCVSAPVLHGPHIIAALAIAVPAERFKKDRADLTATVLDIVRGLRLV
jgi:IclR family acetate operon transcriptional repressor